MFFHAAGERRQNNKGNEILTRNRVRTPYTVAPDALGNMTDDGRDYKFIYDVWGRLVRVDNQSDQPVAAYRYNGLGQRTGWHYDNDEDGELDSADHWYYFCLDERGRTLATFRADDTYPKETFAYHAAGLGGYGTASYIDSVILRDRDMTGGGGWTGEADNVREERIYYCQNASNDVCTVLDGSGSVPRLIESVKYFTFGTPFGLPAGDLNSDGEFTEAEYEYIKDSSNWTTPTPPVYDARADVNLNGVVDVNDANLLDGLQGTTLGRGVLSRADVFNRKGFRQWDNDGVLGASDTEAIAIAVGDGVGNSRFWFTRGGVWDGTMGRGLARDRGVGIGDGDPWRGRPAPPGFIVSGPGYNTCTSGEQGGAIWGPNGWVYYECKSVSLLPVGPPPRPTFPCHIPFYCFSEWRKDCLNALLKFGACEGPNYTRVIGCTVACAIGCLPLFPSPAAYAGYIAGCDLLCGLAGGLADRYIGGLDCWGLYKQDRAAADFRYCQCLSASARLCGPSGAEPNLAGVPCGTGGLPGRPPTTFPPPRRYD